MTYPRQRQADQGPRGGFTGYVEAPQTGLPYAGGRPYVPPPQSRPASAPPQSRPASTPPQLWYASGPRPYIGAAADESYGRHARQNAAASPAPTYPGQYGFRRRATYAASPRYSTPPAYSGRHSTPPAYDAPRVSTPPAYTAPPRASTPRAYTGRHSAPPAYSGSPRHSTPPAYSGSPRHSTPPAYAAPPRVSTPPAYEAPPRRSTPPAQTGEVTDSGFPRRRRPYPGPMDDSGFPQRQTGYTGSVTDSGFQRRHSGYQDALTDSGLQRRAGWAQNAHTSGNLRRYIGEEDFPATAPTVERGSNGYAVVAFLFGVLGGWFALVFGPLGIRRANETGRGKGLAAIGLILGLLWLPVQGVFAYQKFVAHHPTHTTVTAALAGPVAPPDPGCVAAADAATKWNAKTNKAIATNDTKAVVADFRGYAADLTAAQKQSQNAAAVAAMKAYAADMTSLANSFAKGSAPDEGAMSRLGSDGATVARACAG